MVSRTSMPTCKRQNAGSLFVVVRLGTCNKAWKRCWAVVRVGAVKSCKTSTACTKAKQQDVICNIALLCSDSLKQSWAKQSGAKQKQSKATQKATRCHMQRCFALLKQSRAKKSEVKQSKVKQFKRNSNQNQNKNAPHVTLLRFAALL